MPRKPLTKSERQRVVKSRTAAKKRAPVKNKLKPIRPKRKTENV